MIKRILLLTVIYLISSLNLFAEDIKCPDSFLKIENKAWIDILNKKITLNMEEKLTNVIQFISKSSGANIVFKSKENQSININFNSLSVKNILYYLCTTYNLNASWVDEEELPHFILLTK